MPCGFVAGAQCVVNRRMQHTRPRLKLVFATAVTALLVDVITKVIAGSRAKGATHRRPRRVRTDPQRGRGILMGCRLHRPARAGSRRDYRRRGVARPARGVDVGCDRLGSGTGGRRRQSVRSGVPCAGTVARRGRRLRCDWLGPIFNAADVCVVIGVTILTWRLLADGRDTASA